MKKKITSLILAFAMLAALLPAMAVQAAKSVNIGDYVQMGSYYGQPILWRCVDIDDNGPLMLSDKIICIKPFDASEKKKSSHSLGSNTKYFGRQANGSPYWTDSNMRSWLNSTASAGRWRDFRPFDLQTKMNLHSTYNCGDSIILVTRLC